MLVPEPPVDVDDEVEFEFTLTVTEVPLPEPETRLVVPWRCFSIAVGKPPAGARPVRFGQMLLNI